MKNKLKSFWLLVKNVSKKSLEVIKTFSAKLFNFVTSWWRAILLVSFIFIFLYYPIGAFMVNNIDKNTEYNFPPLNDQKQSSSIEMMSHIVDREVNQKTWTPNLPFFFPSAVLDNMPNFQLGMFDALSDFSKSFGRVFPQSHDIKLISENLSYPGTIWMFSPENKITPVSSANKMYRDARKKLKDFNRALGDGSETFNKRSYDLAYILGKTEQNISKSVAELEKHVFEEKDSYIDGKSDDIFFYTQGKLYAYFLLLNALEQDYREIIVSQDLYSDWTVMVKSLANGAKINPGIVRNADLDSIASANHLTYLGYYTLKADTTIQKIVNRLERPLINQ